MQPSREKARLYDKEEAAKASSAEVVSAAGKKLSQAVKQQDGLGRGLKDNVMKEGPIKETEEEYMLDQLDALGLEVERSRPKNAQDIDARVRQQMLERDASRVLNMRPQTIGNIGNRLGSPSTSAGINAAALNAEAKERARIRREEEEVLAEEEQDIEDGDWSYGRSLQAGATGEGPDGYDEEMSAEDGSGSIGSFSYFLFLIILTIAVTSDILDFVMDITAIGSLFAPVKSLIVGAVLGVLWWMVGGRSRSKNVKRMIGSVGVDAFPILNVLPVETLSSAICIYLTIKSDNKKDFESLALPAKNKTSGGVGNAA